MAYRVVVIKQARDLGLWDQRLEYGPYDSKERALATGREHKAAGAFDAWLTSEFRESGKFYFEEFID